MSHTIEINAVGPVVEFEYELAEPGVHVITGDHGAGKTTILRTVELATGGRVEKPTKMDGAKSGSATIAGKTLKIGKVVREEGELSLQGLTDLDLSGLHTPKFLGPHTRDAHRIKALARLAGVAADPALFHELLGCREEFDAVVDADVLDNGTVVDDLSAIWPLPNVWLGTTVENQEWADKRIPWLLKCPAAVRFLSVEPMLGAIDLSAFMGGPYVGLPGDCVHENYNFGIDWTICGGESGRNARPMHPDCVMSLRGQCAAAVVPFFFKQWGEWSPLGTHRDRGIVAFNDGRSCEFTADAMRDEERRSGVAHNRCHPLHMYRVGKKAAGRLLDGVEHSEFPAAPEPAV